MSDRVFPRLRARVQPRTWQTIDAEGRIDSHVEIVRRYDAPEEPPDIECSLCGVAHRHWQFDERMKSGDTPAICGRCRERGYRFGNRARDYSMPWGDVCFLGDAAAALKTLEAETKNARA